ncbi:MAG: YARHG domain-containing protein [Lachnospiraceae bacterium]|nr:YARHG domain-containing protein [Lachnospiraceae bacterium]
MKRRIVAGIAGVMLLFLSACGAEEKEQLIVVEEAVPDSSMEKTESGTEMPLHGSENPADANADSDTGSNLDSKLDSNKNSYIGVYQQIVSEMEEEGTVFSLIYLDNDDIPELAVCDRRYDAYSVYTVKEDSAFCIMDAMITVEMTYFEQKGVLAQFARWNGGGDEGGYGWYYYQMNADKTLADDSVPDLHFTYNAIYDDEGNWTGARDYYCQGEEISEADYQKKLNDMGIVDGNSRICMENALGKKEMLELLEQDAKQVESGKALAEAEGQIAGQSFETELYGFGKVVFAPFEPLSYPSENPDYGTTTFGDVRFMLLSPADGKTVYEFPGTEEDNILPGFTQFREVLSVAFKDYNEDGKTDILLILEYLNSEGTPFRKARVYSQKDGEQEFWYNRNLSEFLWDYTESMEQLCKGIAVYQESYSTYYAEDLSEEELMEFLDERGGYYQKSAYYPEIIDYWENVREVRDVSNHIIPLYESSTRYLTKEELASAPPVVIHLAKNEIYARHGYIFKEPDLYNYFMGCIWYTPAVAPEDFREEMLNEYEKENLKLFAELDTM